MNIKVTRFMNGDNLLILRIVEAQMFLFMRVYSITVEQKFSLYVLKCETETAACSCQCE